MDLRLSGASRAAPATTASAFPHPPQVKTEYNPESRLGNATKRERRFPTLVPTLPVGTHCALATMVLAFPHLPPNKAES